MKKQKKPKKCKHNVYIQNCDICNTKKDKQILHRANKVKSSV